MDSWRIGFSRSNRRTFLRCVAALIIASGVLVAPTGAGASEACGEISFGFEGTRLLNDGISDSAGPFPIELAPGTYDVTLVAHDFHSEQSSVGTQPGEQFVVELDNGYVSPPSLDIPDDSDTTTTVHGSQQISTPATAISVHHLGVPGVNSVNVLCVGFDPIAETTPVEPIEPDGSGDGEEESEVTRDEPSESTDDSTDEPGDDEPSANDEPGDDADDDANDDDSSDDEPGDDDSPGEGATDADTDEPAAGDDDDINSGSSSMSDSVDPTEPVPEVLGLVEEATPAAGSAAAQTPQLAITGRNNSLAFALFAFGLVLLGGSFVLASDQRNKTAVVSRR